MYSIQLTHPMDKIFCVSEIRFRFIKNYLNGSSKTNSKTQVYIVDSNSKMYVEIIYKLIL